MTEMRNTFEVMDAVQTGAPATELELRYALQNVRIWHARMVFDLARACTETPLSDKTKRGLQRAWDTWKSGNEVPLDRRLRGGSYEPGITREMSHERWLQHSTDTAMNLVDALNDLAKGKSDD